MCDLTVKIGKKCIHAHKIVLASSSDYFDKLLTGGFKETNKKKINIEGIEATAFELIVDYIYTSQLKLTDHNVQVKLHVLNNLKILLNIDFNCLYKE